jgi:arsenical pump membrane protein
MSAGFLEFSRVGALTTPLCLVAGVLALWAAARVLGL